MKTCVGIVLLGLMFVAAVLPYFGRYAWWLDMPNHFRFQAAAMTLIGVGIVAAVVRRKWALLGLGAVVLQLAPTWAVLARPDGSADGVRVAHANVGGWSTSDVNGWLAGLEADVAFLLEVQPTDTIATQPPPGWRFALQRPSIDSRGVIVLVPEWAVRHPARIESFTVPNTTREMAVIEIDGVQILQIHLARPGNAGGFAEQVAMTQAVARWVESADPDAGILVLGDFNAAPWSGAVAPLRDAGLTPLRGGVTGTWPATLPAGARVPIDHALSNRRGHLTVGPNLGGDHRPIVVQLTE